MSVLRRVLGGAHVVVLRTPGGLGNVGAARDQGLERLGVACVDASDDSSRWRTSFMDAGRGPCIAAIRHGVAPVARGEDNTTRNATLSASKPGELAWGGTLPEIQFVNIVSIIMDRRRLGASKTVCC